MDKKDSEQYYGIVREVAQAAGDRLKKISERRVNSDAGNDVKLQEDVESELFIREKLAATGVRVVGEEKGGDASLLSSGELYWVVDPIDGTYNFLRGIPGVCVSIGLMSGLTPVVGAIYDFTRNELFLGGKGFPLTVNGEKVSPKWAKSVSQGVLMTGFPSATDYSDDNLKRFVMAAQKFKKVRMCGSAACAMAWVASGRADSYHEERLYLWDVAGGLSLMESVGAAYEVVPQGILEKPFCISIRAAANREFFI